LRKRKEKREIERNIEVRDVVHLPVTFLPSPRDVCPHTRKYNTSLYMWYKKYNVNIGTKI
jgi:hypothetical protein